MANMNNKDFELDMNEEIKKICQEQLMTSSDICKLLNIPRQRVTDLMKSGKIKPFITTENGRHLFWKQDILDSYCKCVDCALKDTCKNCKRKEGNYV